MGGILYFPILKLGSLFGGILGILLYWLGVNLGVKPKVLGRAFFWPCFKG